MKVFISNWDSEIREFVARDPTLIKIRFVAGGDHGKVFIFYEDVDTNAEDAG